jgi:hypothetical protein
MFILSVEGPDHANKGMWSTHAVLAANPNREVILAFVEDRRNDPNVDTEEEIFLLTEIRSGGVKKVERL